MPHPEVTKAIKEAVTERELPNEVGQRILAYLAQAESSEFANREREQQLSLILDCLPGLSTDGE
jgi:hypothetical protein